jgi:hypothetical protein
LNLIIVNCNYIVYSIAANNKPGKDVPDMPAGAGEESVANIDKLRHMKGDCCVFITFCDQIYLLFIFRQYQDV